MAMLKLCILSGCSSVAMRVFSEKTKDGKNAAVVELGDGFSSNLAKVNNTTLHYVRGGSGPAVILLHGFPQNWYEYHKVMPELAKRYTVIAVDTRGIGNSKATSDGNEAANLAEDIRQLVALLKLNRPYIVGHDMGGMVAYAFARRFPDKTKGVLILELVVPGTEAWKKVRANPLLWHINFHQTPDLPEKLISGRQSEYFRHFFNHGTIDNNAIGDAEADHYLEAHSTPDQLRAAMEIYRAVPANEKYNASLTDDNPVPIVLAGGDKVFGPLLPALAKELREQGCTNITVEIIKNSSHYIPDENPKALIDLIERYVMGQDRK